MKKLLFKILIAAMLLPIMLVGCDNGESNLPTEAPTAAPTQTPTEAPTQAPTEKPTQAPTETPTEAPTEHICQGVEWIVVSEPSCTENGEKKLVCECQKVLETAQIDALGHTAGADATCTAAQTCTVCGEILTDALGHTAGADATCTTAQTCTVCGETLTDALGHTAGADATCTEAQTCTVCGEILTDALGHNAGRKATCTTAQLCTVCEEILTEALGHTTGAEATCTSAQICTVCEEILVAPLGHNYVDGECTRCQQKPKKYFTLSFDDGTTQDLRIIEILKKYGVDCCTFNINTGLYGVDWSESVSVMAGTPVSHVRFTKEELQTGIYDGFEVAVHTSTHPSLKYYDDLPTSAAVAGINSEVKKDAANIKALTGIAPVGMAWPGGDTEFTDKTIELVLKYTNMKYARCTTPTYSFALPERFMRWYPTCSFSDAKLFELAQQFIDAECTEDMLFYVWGHGFEMDIPWANSYDEFEQLIKMISEQEDIVLVTNAEFYELFKSTITS